VSYFGKLSMVSLSNHVVPLFFSREAGLKYIYNGNTRPALIVPKSTFSVGSFIEGKFDI